jgi:hypothetical protein
MRVLALDDATGDPIPFRARVIGVENTERPSLGPIWSAAGARDTALSGGGPLEVSLPLGEYDVVVSHGPEWTLAHQRTVVTGVGTFEITVRLHRVVDAGAWVPSDFHVHADPSSDSHVTLADRVTALVAEGVRFAVPTDHNQVTDYAPVIQETSLPLESVPGVEVTTAEPAFGHFNAYPYPIDPTLPANGAPEFVGLTPARLFASLHETSSDIIVQVNHPHFENGIGYFDHTSFDPATGRGDETYSDDYDALEVWNGFDLSHPALVERNLAEWIAMLMRGRRVIATGNSDSHTISTELAGYPRTYVDTTPDPATDPPADPNTPFSFAQHLLSALRAGRAFVTNGPFVDLRVGDQGPGRHVAPTDRRVRVELRILAPSWIEVDSVDVYLGDRIVETFPIPARRARAVDRTGLRFARTFDVPVERSSFVIAVVRGEAPMEELFARRDIRPFAFTNPVWIDVPP